MNKLTIFIALLVLTISAGLNGQEAGAVGTPPSQYPVLTKKIQKSNNDVENPKKASSSKFWLSRAELLMDVYAVNLQHLGKGAQMTNLRLLFGEPLEKATEQKEGKTYEIHTHEKVVITYVDGVVDSYKEINKIQENTLDDALISLDKAFELDVDGKLTKKLKEGYDRLKSLLEREGLEYYVSENYKESYKSFKAGVTVNLMDMNKSVIDTSMIFNVGMVASKANMTDESIKYYEMALSYNYPEPAIYVYLKNKYIEAGDSAKGIETLLKGFETYPESNDIVIEMINYYLSQEKGDEALEYIAIAQAKDPTNVSLMFVEGTLYDKKGETQKAIEVYKKCTEIDPEFYNGYFNLGVVYYNLAQKIYEEAGKIRNDAEYKAKMKEGDETLGMAIEPMKACMGLKPDDISVLDVLKSVYYRLKMTDDYEEIKEKISKLK